MIPKSFAELAKPAIFSPPINLPVFNQHVLYSAPHSGLFVFPSLLRRPFHCINCSKHCSLSSSPVASGTVRVLPTVYFRSAPPPPPHTHTSHVHTVTLTHTHTHTHHTLTFGLGGGGGGGGRGEVHIMQSICTHKYSLSLSLAVSVFQCHRSFRH